MLAWVASVFTGSLDKYCAKSSIKLRFCSSVKEHKDDMLLLPTSKHVSWSFNKLLQTESLYGDNKWFCPQCSFYQISTKETCIRPSIKYSLFAVTQPTQLRLAEWFFFFRKLTEKIFFYNTASDSTFFLLLFQPGRIRSTLSLFKIVVVFFCIKLFLNYKVTFIIEIHIITSCKQVTLLFHKHLIYVITVM